MKVNEDWILAMVEELIQIISVMIEELIQIISVTEQPLSSD